MRPHVKERYRGFEIDVSVFPTSVFSGLQYGSALIAPFEGNWDTVESLRRNISSSVANYPCLKPTSITTYGTPSEDGFIEDGVIISEWVIPDRSGEWTGEVIRLLRGCIDNLHTRRGF